MVRIPGMKEWYRSWKSGQSHLHANLPDWQPGPNRTMTDAIGYLVNTLFSILSMVAATVSGGREAGAGGSLVETWRRWVEPELRDVATRLESLRAEQADLPEAMSRPDYSQPGYRSLPSGEAATEKWVQVDLGEVVPVDDIVLIPAVLPGPGGAPVPVGFPARFRVELSMDEGFGERVTVADFSQADVADPGAMPVVVGRADREARYVRVTALQLRGEPDNHFFALGELVVTSGNRNVAQGAVVTALDALGSPRWRPEALTDGVSAAGRPVERRLQPTNGYHGAIEMAANVTQWVQVDLGKVVPIDHVVLMPARPVDFPDTIGFGFPVRFKVEVAEDETMDRARVLADFTAADFPNPGDRELVLGADDVHGRYVRVTAEKLWPRRQPREYVFALAELVVVSGGVNVAADKRVTESSPLDEGPSAWGPEYLVDGIAPRGGVGTYAEWLSALARRHVVDNEIAALTGRMGDLRNRAERTLAWIACGLAGAVVVAGAGTLWGVRSREARQVRRLRERIARDLHDDIGSNLGSIALMAQLGIEADPEPVAMRSELDEIRRVASQTADSMHDIVWLISPGPRTAGDLAARLRDSAGLLLGGVRWTMEVDGLGDRRIPSIEVQRDIFLIFKETLNNIRRHAGAANVQISLACGSEGLCLRISDDGAGFDPGATRRGQGLTNMERRARECRGRLVVDSSPGRGTVVTLTIPLK
jgi:signal transduction histidine kinase